MVANGYDGLSGWVERGIGDGITGKAHDGRGWKGEWVNGRFGIE